MSNNEEKLRLNYGLKSGIIGIVTNSLLCISKIFVGMFFGIVSITADGINNLSDTGSSAISLVGYKMSGKPADKKHPFGHARLEYVLSLIIGISIIAIGLNLIVGSVDKIISKSATPFKIVSIIILAASIVLKIMIMTINFCFFKKTGSLPLKAIAVDALNDIISTSCIILALIISRYTSVNLDGYAGVLISILIIVSGVKIISEVLTPLLGERPCKELVEKICNKLNGTAGVLGIHDLTIHNYGPNRNFASVHVEVDANVDILVSHDMIDNIEREFRDENVILVIHLDPVVVNDSATSNIKMLVIEKLKSINCDLTLHDFRMVWGATHSNLIFDVVVPTDFNISDQDLIQQIQDKVSEIDKNYFIVIEIDRNYIS